ncbi:MAG TPA: hypothetical protein VIK97_18460 [Casimicrobiaceae bacterium]
MKPAQDTVLRYGRTHASSRDAFPDTCEYACALEKPRFRLGVDDWVALCAAAGLFIAALGFWLAPLIPSVAAAHP